MTNTQYTRADAVGLSIAIAKTISFATHFIAACAHSTRATGQFGKNSTATKPLATRGETPC